MALFEVFIDESGCKDNYSKVLAVGAYLFEADQAKEMDRKWRELLERHRLPYFHMVDCAHGNKTFEHLPGKKNSDARNAIQREYMALIKQHASLGACVAMLTFRHQQLLPQPDDSHDSYVHCLIALIGHLRASIGPNNHMICVLEAGHDSAGKASNVFLKSVNKGEIAGFSFGKKGLSALASGRRAVMAMFQTD